MVPRASKDIRVLWRMPGRSLLFLNTPHHCFFLVSRTSWNVTRLQKCIKTQTNPKQLHFMAIHSNFFSLIFPSFSLTFLPFFAEGALVIYAKIPRKLKKAICSFFFLFFWSAQNFSYCSWLVLPSLGSKQLALEAFVMSRLRLDIFYVSPCKKPFSDLYLSIFEHNLENK